MSWGSFRHLFDSIGHALRHAAMTLKTAVIKLAEDGKSWLVDLVVQIGDDIWTAADLVITDMKHAFHVIGGFFNALGADIKSAVQWLWHDIVAFLKNVKVTANQLQAWITQLGGEVISALQQIKLDTDNWFSAKEQQAHDAISYMKNKAEGTLGGPPLPPPTSDTGSTGSQNKLLHDLGEIANVMNDVPGKWLMDKFLSYLPVTDPGPEISQSTYQPLLEQLAKDWVDGMTFSQNLFTFIQTTMSDGFSSGGAADKGALTDTQLTAWFTELDNTVVNGLQLLDDVADTALDIAVTGVALAEDYFTYQYNIVGSMGLIGFILEEAGVDFGFSLAEIVSWVVAFPAALVGQCLGYSSLFPPAEPATALGRLRASLGNDSGRFPRDTESGRSPVRAPSSRGRTGRRGAGRPAGESRERSRRLAGRAGHHRRRGPGCLGNGRPGRRRAAAGRPGHGQARHAVGGHRLLRHPLPAGRDGRAVAERAELGRLGVLSLPRRARHQHQRLGAAAVRHLDGRHPLRLRGRGQGRLDRDLSNSGFPSGVQDIAKDYLAPFIQMIAGTANTVLGSVYSAKNDAGAVAITGTVLGNLSFVGAPLATKIMNETTDDISTLVKLVIMPWEHRRRRLYRRGNKPAHPLRTPAPGRPGPRRAASSLHPTSRSLGRGLRRRHRRRHDRPPRPPRRRNRPERRQLPAQRPRPRPRPRGHHRTRPITTKPRRRGQISTVARGPEFELVG